MPNNRKRKLAIEEPQRSDKRRKTKVGLVTVFIVLPHAIRHPTVTNAIAHLGSTSGTSIASSLNDSSAGSAAYLNIHYPLLYSTQMIYLDTG